MGNKGLAKNLMLQAGIPVLEGLYLDQKLTPDLLKKIQQLKYPLLIKAAHGGGGKGMRVVESPQNIEQEIFAAQREAENYFQDSSLVLETFLKKPRHIEVQVLADLHGNCLCLSDRDCSMQRRHQKIIEEAPAPGLSPKTRQAMFDAATQCVHALQYTCAGTLEFLVDEDESFYFMEMNTRLQVEHPVTEMIHQIDLVAWQLKICAGESLPPAEAFPAKGHAMEARIYAEDPSQDFLPCTGQIYHLFEPQLTHCRIDSSLLPQQSITPFFDPMLAKVVAWGNTRQEAIARLSQALAAYQIAGCQTNLDYLNRLINHPKFLACELDTAFTAKYNQALLPEISLNTTELAAAFLMAAMSLTKQVQSIEASSPWHSLAKWRMHGTEPDQYDWQDTSQKRFSGKVQQHEHDIEVSMANQTFVFTAQLLAHGLQVIWQGRQYQVPFRQQGQSYWIYWNAQDYQFVPYQYQAQKTDDPQSQLVAPMNATIINQLVSAGTQVKSGDHLMILEAMKMEYTIKAPFDGLVQCVHFQVGDQVNDGSTLLDMEAQ